jgi:predicted MPP superfamily phosphohydrolase
VRLAGLAPEFDGFRIAQLSDIHMEEFTEPFFLREAVRRINSLRADAVFLTGDFVSKEIGTERFAEGTAWQCANLLAELECPLRFAIFGNHDAMVSEDIVGAALKESGITVLRNSNLLLERGRGRLWLAGLDDPLEGRPDVEQAIPESIRNKKNEPIIFLCHAPDFVNRIKNGPIGQAVNLMLSGHTHGGQVRIPFMPVSHLPPMGRRYIAGWYRLGGLQLYVNRGLGTVGVPLRFNCPPEISAFTLRA